MLANGTFGNTVPQWFDVRSWEASDESSRYPLWGIRSGVAGGDKRMRLNVPSAEVSELFQAWFPGGGGNISPMVDEFAQLRAEVWESNICPFGLSLFYVPCGMIDQADPWRGSFRKYGKPAHGIEAKALLSHYLWASDLADLEVLLETYPGHVVELSACSKAVGVIPNRNTIIWEVRKY